MKRAINWYLRSWQLRPAVAAILHVCVLSGLGFSTWAWWPGETEPRNGTFQSMKSFLHWCKEDRFWKLTDPVSSTLRGRPLVMTMFGPDGKYPTRAIWVYQERGGESMPVRALSLCLKNNFSLFKSADEQEEIVECQRKAMGLVLDMTGLWLSDLIFSPPPGVQQAEVDQKILEVPGAYAMNFEFEKDGFKIDVTHYGTPAKKGGMNVHESQVIIKDNSW